MGLLRKLLVVVIVLGILVGGIAAAFLTGMLGEPEAGLEDHGDWGTVTEEQTEVITTFWVQNPNPIGITVGNSIDLSYRLFLNDINLAQGQKNEVSIQPGNNTLRLSTFIQNNELPSWWVAFINNEETIPLRVNASAHVSAGPLSTTFQFPSFEEILLSDTTPIINALSEAAASAEGNYTKSLSVEAGPVGETETVGYQVQRGWATWGDVTEETTTVLFHFQVHNPSRTVAVPAVPDGLGVSVEMNNLTMFQAQGDELSPKNVDGDSVIPPGETQEVILEVEMNNTKIDDWFTSHVEKGEQTQIRTRLQMVFMVDGTEFRIPEDQGPAYTCQLQTAILVDDQETMTTCGDVPSGSSEEASDNGSESESTTESRVTASKPNATVETPDQNLSEEINVTATLVNETLTASTPNVTPRNTVPERSTSTATPTPTLTPTPTPQPPTARVSANQTEGDAPLTVAFDASDSTDPDGDIEEFIWRFKDGSPPANGETVTHTFDTAGEYEVELVVVDSQGNRDSTTVTITVESRL